MQLDARWSRRGDDHEEDHHSYGPRIRVGRRVGHYDGVSSAASNRVEASCCARTDLRVDVSVRSLARDRSPQHLKLLSPTRDDQEETPFTEIGASAELRAWHASH